MMGVRSSVRCLLPRAGLAFGLLVTGACALTPPFIPPGREVSELAWLRDPHPREYVLEIGDVFDLKLFYHPELNDTGVVVRPDGKISAQLVGDIVARGKTPSELAAELVERLAQAGLRQPKVAVLLRKSAGLRVFVGGEVNNPGMIPHDGRLTISRAILQAGGPKATAEVETVVLLRDAGNRNGAGPLFAVVDFNKVLGGGSDPLLQPYDVIFVPQSRIARLNQFVDQYFVKLIPITLSAGFSYTLGRVTER